MVVEDYFTKWTEAIPIPNAEATTVARKFVERIVTIFGVPLSIHSDQGSKVFKVMCHVLGIHKTRTTQFRPKWMVWLKNQTQPLKQCHQLLLVSIKEIGMIIYIF